AIVCRKRGGVPHPAPHVFICNLCQGPVVQGSSLFYRHPELRAWRRSDLLSAVTITLGPKQDRSVIYQAYDLAHRRHSSLPELRIFPSSRSNALGRFLGCIAAAS